MKKSSFLLIAVIPFLLTACDLNKDSKTYTVTYDGNGYDTGSLPVDGTEYAEGDSVTVAEAGTMGKTGYTFSTWNTTKDGTGTARAPKATFNMPSEDVALYAQWTAGGKLTVTISNAVTYTGHSLYYSIYDSNDKDPVTHAPSGNILGQARLEIVNNAGSVITGTSTSDPTEKVFANGTYYLGGMVDMNDNAASTGYVPDTGDKYGDLLTVAISGDTTFAVTESDFSLTY